MADEKCERCLRPVRDRVRVEQWWWCVPCYTHEFGGSA